MRPTRKCDDYYSSRENNNNIRNRTEMRKTCVVIADGKLVTNRAIGGFGVASSERKGK